MNWTWPAIWNGERGGWWRVPMTFLLWVAGMVAGIVLAIVISTRGVGHAFNSTAGYVSEIVRLLTAALFNTPSLWPSCSSRCSWYTARHRGGFSPMVAAGQLTLQVRWIFDGKPHGCRYCLTGLHPCD